MHIKEIRSPLCSKIKLRQDCKPLWISSKKITTNYKIHLFVKEFMKSKEWRDGL